MCGSCGWFKHCRAVCEEEKILARRETVKLKVFVRPVDGQRTRRRAAQPNRRIRQRSYATR